MNSMCVRRGGEYVSYNRLVLRTKIVIRYKYNDLNIYNKCRLNTSYDTNIKEGTSRTNVPQLLTENKRQTNQKSKKRLL